MSLITITSGIGCEETNISQRVADELKLELFDDRRVQQRVIDMGLSSDEVKKLDEKAPGLFNRLLRRKPDLYLDLLEAAVYEIARQGEGIVFGHGAQFLLRDFECALHVRIFSSEPSRIKRVMDEQGVSSEAAAKIIQKNDNERRGFLQFVFHIDWNDPSLYDLVINCDKLGIDSAARLITEVAQSDVVKACSIGALEAMERRSLLKKVQAALLRNDIDTTELHLEVPEQGVVQITGSMNPLFTEDNLIEIVKSVSGVSEVQSDIATPRISDIG
jgi:cytidylate kinase